MLVPPPVSFDGVPLAHHLGDQLTVVLAPQGPPSPVFIFVRYDPFIGQPSSLGNLSSSLP